ncbi:hypothetical protein P4S73_12075 [Paraglaciecola sp. Hal342]
MYNYSKKLLVVIISTGLFACSATQSVSTQPSNNEATNPSIAQHIKVHLQLMRQNQTHTDGTLTLEQIMADPIGLAASRSAVIGRQWPSPFFIAKREGVSFDPLICKVDSQNASEAQQVALSKLHAVSYSDSVTNPQGTYSAWVFEGNIFVIAYRAVQGQMHCAK